MKKEENKNLNIQEPAESSSLASECPDSTVGREQLSYTSEINISDAEVETQDNSVPNLPVIKDVELEQGEDLFTTSSMDMELSSLLVVEDATQGSKTGVTENFTKSIEESHVSEGCAFEERKNVCSISASVITYVEELHSSSQELSTAPESITGYINRPQITNNTSLISQVSDQPDLTGAEFSFPMDVEDSRQGGIDDAIEELPDESHATYEEDKSACNDFSTSVITNGEVNPANSMCAYKIANLENGSTSSSGDIQNAITNSDLGSSAAMLKQHVCASNANLNNGSTSSHGSAVKLKNTNLSNGSTSSHGSAVKLKPIFTPGFLVKRPRKEVSKPANFSEMVPRSDPNDQTNVRR